VQVRANYPVRVHSLSDARTRTYYCAFKPSPHCLRYPYMCVVRTIDLAPLFGTDPTASAFTIVAAYYLLTGRIHGNARRKLHSDKVTVTIGDWYEVADRYMPPYCSTCVGFAIEHHMCISVLVYIYCTHEFDQTLMYVHKTIQD
jgi:hypothetical protein